MGGYDEGTITGAASFTFFLIITIWFVINVLVSPEFKRQAAVRVINEYRLFIMGV